MAFDGGFDGTATGGGGGSGDVTPPDAVATAPTGTIHAEVRDGVYTVTVSDAGDGPAFVAIAVKFSGATAAEVVYMGEGPAEVGVGWGAGYEGSTFSDLDTGEWEFRIRRTGGWPAGEAATFLVRAVDGAGNVLA